MVTRGQGPGERRGLEEGSQKAPTSSYKISKLVIGCNVQQDKDN